jgi:hypothetical protein
MEYGIARIRADTLGQNSAGRRAREVLSKTYHGQISRRVTTQGSQTVNKGLPVAKHLRRLHPR